MTTRMLIHVRRKAHLLNNIQTDGTPDKTGKSGVETSTLDWRVAGNASSGSGGGTTTEWTEESHELKSRAERTVSVIDISAAGLASLKGRGKDVEAEPLTSTSAYSYSSRGHEYSPGKSAVVHLYGLG